MEDSMHTTSLRKVGGSIMVAVPPALLNALGLGSGSKVDLTVEGGRLVVQQQQRQRYTLDELLAQCDPNAPHNQEDQEWIDGKSVGNELI
jgi:antitoxin ChpS